MATVFGNETEETSNHTADSGEIDAAKSTLTETGTVTVIHVYCACQSGHSQQTMCAIYDNDGTAGAPLTRLGYTNEITLASGQLVGWVEYTLTVPLLLVAGDYFLAIHRGVTGWYAQVRYGASGGDMRYGAASYGTPPATWPGTSGNAIKLAIHAHYTVPATGCPKQSMHLARQRR